MKVAARATRRRALVLVTQLAVTTGVVHAFHLRIHSGRVLHALADLGLNEVLVDLVNVHLRKFLEMLHSAIGQLLLARLYHNEDMLEKLAHHLLDRVDNANVEAVERKF